MRLLVDPICDYCGCRVPMSQLLYHEAMHDQQRLLWDQAQAFMESTQEAIVLLHELIHDLEARVDV